MRDEVLREDAIEAVEDAIEAMADAVALLGLLTVGDVRVREYGRGRPSTVCTTVQYTAATFTPGSVRTLPEALWR